MKKTIRLMALLLAVVMCFGMLAACSSEDSVVADDEKVDGATADSGENKGNEPTDDENADEEAYAGEYDVLKMGTNAQFPPYEYKEGEEFVGIDIEIATAIAEELGAELEVVDMEFDSIITSVNQGEVSFGMAGMTVTDERLEEVDFTYSYATGVQSVIVAEDSDIATIDDLYNDKMIGVQLGTTGDIYSCDDFGSDHVTQYGKGADAVIALMGGDVDAVIIDNAPAAVFVSENEGLKLLDTEYAVEDYAIAISKDNTQLLDDINLALEKLTEDGTIDEIIAKYISAE